MTSQPDRPVVTGGIDTDENGARAREALESGPVTGSEDYHSGYGAGTDSEPEFVSGPDGVTDADRTAYPTPDGDVPADEDPDLVVMTPRDSAPADGTGTADDDLHGTSDITGEAAGTELAPDPRSTGLTERDVITAAVIETEFTSTGLNGSPATGPVPGNPVPGNPVPGNPVPGNPVPGNPVPGNPVPGNPVPGNPVPGNPVPGNTAAGATGMAAHGTAAQGTGQVGDRSADGLDQQWHDIQAMFVDDPRGSVDRAAAAADAAVSALVETLHQRQAALVPAGSTEGDRGDTEQLREALRSYRIFCQRIANLGQQLPEAAATAR